MSIGADKTGWYIKTLQNCILQSNCISEMDNILPALQSKIIFIIVEVFFIQHFRLQQTNVIFLKIRRHRLKKETGKFSFQWSGYFRSKCGSLKCQTKKSLNKWKMSCICLRQTRWFAMAPLTYPTKFIMYFHSVVHTAIHQWSLDELLDAPPGLILTGL